MFESTMIEVFNNADIILQNFNKISAEYGITLTDNLKAPWVKLSEQATVTKNDIDTMLDSTEVSIGVFKTSVNSTIDELYTRMQQTSSDFTAYLSDPYNKVTASGGPINTFSTKTESALTNAVYKAQSTANEMATSNKKPWNDGVTAINTWSKSVESGYNKAIQKAKEYEAAANRAKNVSTPSYYSGTSSGKSGGKSNSGKNSSSSNNNNTPKFNTNDVKMLQQILLKVFGQNVNLTGSYDLKTKNGVKNMQKKLQNSNHYKSSVDGLYGIGTYNALVNYVNDNIKASRSKKKPSWFNGNAVLFFQNRSSYIPRKMYAKGTLGTKKDQWAITDEPQFGDELTLVPTKQGNLSYMRKGTSVVPATITEELLKLADVGVDGLTMPKFDSGINLNIVNNAINKPELNIDIENFLRCDNVNHDTMPELEKFVDKKMNDFMKQLNYAIRKFK